MILKTHHPHQQHHHHQQQQQQQQQQKQANTTSTVPSVVDKQKTVIQYVRHEEETGEFELSTKKVDSHTTLCMWISSDEQT